MNETKRLNQRMPGEDRKRQILEQAAVLSKSKGFTGFSSTDIAKAIGCVHPNILYHFKTMGNLRDEMMKKAIKEQDLTIIGQGLIARNTIAIAAPESIKKKAARALNQ